MDPLALWEHVTGPGGLLFVFGLIIWTNYLGVWEWGRHSKEKDARHAAETAELKARIDLWQSLALKNEEHTRTALELARAKGMTP